MFTFAPDRKERVLKVLKDAITSIENGNVEILEDICIGINSDGNGYTRHKDSFFFGIEFRLIKPTGRPSYVPVAREAPTLQAPVAQTALSTPTTGEPAKTSWAMPDVSNSKMSEHYAQQCKKDGKYHCPKNCGFVTESSTGLKKHFNRCGTL
jgi:hypothetical protein